MQLAQESARNLTASLFVSCGDTEAIPFTLAWNSSGCVTSSVTTSCRFSGNLLLSNLIRASEDGSVVVGWGTSAIGPEAFRWTQAGGMVGLGDLPGGEFSSTASSVSADGSVVVGHSSSTVGGVAFIWDANNGMRSIQEILVIDHGLDLEGWLLRGATGVSADGLTIVGSGINPQGAREAWIVRLTLAPADIDGDGEVGVPDLLLLLAQWGPCPPVCLGDINGDGSVNVPDLLLLLANWGPCQ